MLIELALKSLRSRATTVSLTVVSITISVLLLLSIQHIKNEAKASFTSTVSGVDLIVGARTGQLNLLLYSVFRIGNATNNIGWDSYQALSQQDEVAWAIPISLGDSHKGFRVLGTTEDYFKHFRFGQKRSLSFASGKPFASRFEAVIGAEVARRLDYGVGDPIILAHGIGAHSFSKHENHPFTIVGIVSATGTPVDQTVHVRLDGIEAIHQGWQSGVDLSRFESRSTADNRNLAPTTITAFMVGLESKLSTFTFQRKVNQYEAEPLLAILPGVALAELWRMMGMVEGILEAISWLVLFASLIGMSTMMLAAMQQRKQEFSVLRAIGARPLFIAGLIQLEVLLIVAISTIVATITLGTGLMLLQNTLMSHFGLNVSPGILTTNTLAPIGIVFIAAILIGNLPAMTAYHQSTR